MGYTTKESGFNAQQEYRLSDSIQTSSEAPPSLISSGFCRFHPIIESSKGINLTSYFATNNIYYIPLNTTLFPEG
jgi:hypothetical protein